MIVRNQFVVWVYIIFRMQSAYKPPCLWQRACSVPNNNAQITHIASWMFPAVRHWDKAEVCAVFLSH